MKTKQYYKNKVAELELELKSANQTIEHLRASSDVKQILEKLVKDNDITMSFVSSAWANGEMVFPDDVPRYVEDLFGGKVIKQEANKAIRITKDGTVTTGLTASSPDKGYSYKLVRE